MCVLSVYELPRLFANVLPTFIFVLNMNSCLGDRLAQTVIDAVQKVKVTCTCSPMGGRGSLPSSLAAAPSFVETEVSLPDSHPCDDSAGRKVCSEYWFMLIIILVIVKFLFGRPTHSCHIYNL